MTDRCALPLNSARLKVANYKICTGCTCPKQAALSNDLKCRMRQEKMADVNTDPLSSVRYRLRRISLESTRCPGPLLPDGSRSSGGLWRRRRLRLLSSLGGQALFLTAAPLQPRTPPGTGSVITHRCLLPYCSSSTQHRAAARLFYDMARECTTCAAAWPPLTTPPDSVIWGRPSSGTRAQAICSTLNMANDSTSLPAVTGVQSRA